MIVVYHTAPDTSSKLFASAHIRSVKGRKAVYRIMIPQRTGLADIALQQCATGAAVLDHSYVERDKWAHEPGGVPEAHDHLVVHADDSPANDSHMKQLARQIAQQSGLHVIFAVKDGSKGPVSWLIDNPDAKRQTDDAALGARQSGPRALASSTAEVAAPIFWITAMSDGDHRPSLHYSKRDHWMAFVGKHPRDVSEFMLTHFPSQPCQIQRGQGIYAPDDGSPPYLEDSTTLHLFAMQPRQWRDLADRLGQHFPEQESFGFVAPKGKSGLFVNPHHVPGNDQGSLTDWEQEA